MSHLIPSIVQEAANELIKSLLNKLITRFVDPPNVSQPILSATALGVTHETFYAHHSLPAINGMSLSHVRLSTGNKNATHQTNGIIMAHFDGNTAAQCASFWPHFQIYFFPGELGRHFQGAHPRLGKPNTQPVIDGHAGHKFRGPVRPQSLVVFHLSEEWGPSSVDERNGQVLGRNENLSLI